ncbi:malto-oligosyltrehalose synthase [Aldersonia sp. NBC_00410]|uniref:malto-oligosyltrehalose synthase n=1 Tax=Aldersonia sp. NBC_00410 TaxID=2975954 RepID=UPI002250CF58|nr:malto-oligosyltrehalose synthase [Aldersonia sp. NBC_00410]MCX5046030.1 malto-oligosyltrehalose synthase [Aldersonia sp. NBC_00410]
MTSKVLSTYRLQLRPDALTLGDAREIVDYLHRLGVTHLYLSPILTAARGSTHGYDVTDPTSVSATLGGPDALRALAAEVRQRGMGLIVDIVPNHLGVGDPRQNPWWWDVLKHGRDSAYADWFDVDWSQDNGAGGRLALPILGSAADLSSLSVDRSGAEPTLALYDKHFPIAPGSDDADPVRIHDRQFYRLVPWQAGISTYRRFFTINELAGVRQEDPRIFEATHHELARWIAEDLIDGVRVDHPDGLADPAKYLRWLRTLIGPQRLLLVEKILGEHEPLDPSLAVDGTTGYDALAELGGVLVDRAGEAALTELSTTLTGAPGDAAWLHANEFRIKQGVLQTALAPDLRRLVTAIRRVAPTQCSVAQLSTALVELLTNVPVYRTDYSPLSGLLGRVAGETEKRNPKLAEPLSVITRALLAGGEPATRFNQICGAVTAKSVEDCLFYRTARLVSLQEVGGSPGTFGRTLSEFHFANSERAIRWPAAMTTLSTHDTKRGEDVRARIGVLSQVAQRWADKLTGWEKLTPSPDGLTALFLLQNMFGVWPADGGPTPALRERLHAYAEKAMRESGRKTSWDEPDAEFEDDVHAWIDAVIDGPVGAELGEFVAELAPHAWSDSLAQKLLQLCAPGIPDVYQGTELWEDSLVDPDNRRTVDFAAHAEILRSLTARPPLDGTGRAKLWAVAHSLWLRRDRPDCFVGGGYAPVLADGAAADHIVAYARGVVAPTGLDAQVVVAAARHTVSVGETGWRDTVVALPEGRWTDRLSGHSYSAKARAVDLFADLPAVLLVRDAQR